MKCQCPHAGEVDPKDLWLYHPDTERPFIQHEPGECQCTNNLRLYSRDGKHIVLCSICSFPGDVPVNN